MFVREQHKDTCDGSQVPLMGTLEVEKRKWNRWCPFNPLTPNEGSIKISGSLFCLLRYNSSFQGLLNLRFRNPLLPPFRGDGGSFVAPRSTWALFCLQPLHAGENHFKPPAHTFSYSQPWIYYDCVVKIALLIWLHLSFTIQPIAATWGDLWVQKKKDSGGDYNLKFAGLLI